MSTRSRRSGVGGSDTLNPATIAFLERSRLVKELESRGLPTTGSKIALSDRLYEFVVNGVRDLPATPVTASDKSAGDQITPQVDETPKDEKVSVVATATPRGRATKRKPAPQTAESTNSEEPESTAPAETRGKRQKTTETVSKIDPTPASPAVKDIHASPRMTRRTRGNQKPIVDVCPEEEKPVVEASIAVEIKEEVTEVPKTEQLSPQKRTRRSTAAIGTGAKEPKPPVLIPEKDLSEDEPLTSFCKSAPEIAEEPEPPELDAPPSLVAETYSQASSQSAEDIPVDEATTSQDSGRPKRRRIARVIATPPPDIPRRRSTKGVVDSENLDASLTESPQEFEAPKEPTAKETFILSSDVFDAGTSSDEDKPKTTPTSPKKGVKAERPRKRNQSDTSLVTSVQKKSERKKAGGSPRAEKGLKRTIVEGVVDTLSSKDSTPEPTSVIKLDERGVIDVNVGEAAAPAAVSSTGKHVEDSDKPRRIHREELVEKELRRASTSSSGIHGVRKESRPSISKDSKERTHSEKDRDKERVKEKPSTGADRPRQTSSHNVPITQRWEQMCREMKLKKEQEVVEKKKQAAVAAQTAALKQAEERKADKGSDSRKAGGAEASSSSRVVMPPKDNVLDSIFDDQQQFMRFWENKTKEEPLIPKTPEKRKERREEVLRRVRDERTASWSTTVPRSIPLERIEEPLVPPPPAPPKFPPLVLPLPPLPLPPPPPLLVIPPPPVPPPPPKPKLIPAAVPSTSVVPPPPRKTSRLPDIAVTSDGPQRTERTGRVHVVHDQRPVESSRPPRPVVPPPPPSAAMRVRPQAAIIPLEREAAQKDKPKPKEHAAAVPLSIDTRPGLVSASASAGQTPSIEQPAPLSATSTSSTLSDNLFQVLKQMREEKDIGDCVDDLLDRVSALVADMEVAASSSEDVTNFLPPSEENYCVGAAEQMESDTSPLDTIERCAEEQKVAFADSCSTSTPPKFVATPTKDKYSESTGHGNVPIELEHREELPFPTEDAPTTATAAPESVESPRDSAEVPHLRPEVGEEVIREVDSRPIERTMIFDGDDDDDEEADDGHKIDFLSTQPVLVADDQAATEARSPPPATAPECDDVHMEEAIGASTSPPPEASPCDDECVILSETGPRSPDVQIIEKENASSDEPERRQSLDVEILSDPAKMSAILKKANDVLSNLRNTKKVEKDEPQMYHQMEPSDDYEPEPEEKPLPDFHGEPVPSDDDALFEAAAGIPPSKRKKKKKGHEEVEEELPPPDALLQLDYYNADLHVKCECEKTKERWWIVHPENSDGLALMWGGVKTTHGLPIPYEYEFPERKESVDTAETPDKKLESTEQPTRQSLSPNEAEVSIVEKDGIKQEELLSKKSSEPEKENRRPRKLAFQIKILEHLSVKHVPFEEAEAHDVRVGFSLTTGSTILGESPRTWCLNAYCKKASNNLFIDYGKAFGVGDVVTSVLDMDACTIEYWVNEKYLGVAFSGVNLIDGEAVYPSLAVKNCKVAVNLGNYPVASVQWPQNPDWTFPAELDLRTLQRGRMAPESKSDCTVLMMVGLPGVGKTTWVRHYLRDHPDEDWTLISPDTVLNQMKVNGLPRSRVHRGRWDMVMGLAAKSMNRYITLGCRRRRNYILDATNCSKDSRKRKLINFKDFRRKCVVLIPSDEDWQSRMVRQARHDSSTIMPVEGILELKATLAIPNPENEPLEEVHFIEPSADRLQQAVDLVARYNEEARPWYQSRCARGRRGRRFGGGQRSYDRGSYQSSNNLSMGGGASGGATASTSNDAATAGNREPLAPRTPWLPNSSNNAASVVSLTITTDFTQPPPGSGALSADFSTPPPPLPSSATSASSHPTPLASSSTTDAFALSVMQSVEQQQQQQQQSSSMDPLDSTTVTLQPTISQSTVTSSDIAMAESITLAVGSTPTTPSATSAPATPTISRRASTTAAALLATTPLSANLTQLLANRAQQAQSAASNLVQQSPVASTANFADLPPPVAPTFSDDLQQQQQQQQTPLAIVKEEISSPPHEPSQPQQLLPTALALSISTRSLSEDSLSPNLNSPAVKATGGNVESPTIVGAPVRYNVPNRPAGIPRSQIAKFARAKEEAKSSGAAFVTWDQTPFIGPVIPSPKSALASPISAPPTTMATFQRQSSSPLPPQFSQISPQASFTNVPPPSFCSMTTTPGGVSYGVGEASPYASGNVSSTMMMSSPVVDISLQQQQQQQQHVYMPQASPSIGVQQGYAEYAHAGAPPLCSPLPTGSMVGGQHHMMASPAQMQQTHVIDMSQPPPSFGGYTMPMVQQQPQQQVMYGHQQPEATVYYSSPAANVMQPPPGLVMQHHQPSPVSNMAPQQQQFNVPPPAVTYMQPPIDFSMPPPIWTPQQQHPPYM